MFSVMPRTQHPQNARKTEIKIAAKKQSRPNNNGMDTVLASESLSIFTRLFETGGALNFYQSFIYDNGALNMQISSFHSMVLFYKQKKPQLQPQPRLKSAEFTTWQ